MCGNELISSSCLSLWMRRKRGRPRTEVPKEVREDIIRAYENGTSIRDLVKRFDTVAYHTMRHRLREWGVEVRPSGWPPQAWKGRLRDCPPPSIDARRQHILDLEEKIAAGKLNLQQAYDHKQAYEKELAILKGVPARFSR